MKLEDAKYILLTTFRRDGTPVPTPVWIVALGDGRFGFATSSSTGKAKRLAHTSRVIVQPSDARGRVTAGTSPVEATAVIVTGSDLETIKGKLKAKYGVFINIARYLGAVNGFVRRKPAPYQDRGVIITPAA
jgi:PPOX class probable F420-dependent enzyme